MIRLDHLYADVANRLCQPAVVAGNPRTQDRMPAAELQRGMNLRDSFFHSQLHIVRYHDPIPPKIFSEFLIRRTFYDPAGFLSDSSFTKIVRTQVSVYMVY